jgi:hypothetical protein
VVGNIKFEQVAHGGIDLLNAGIAEFHHFFARDTNQVVVLFKSISLLKMRCVFAKLVFFYQTRIYQ